MRPPGDDSRPDTRKSQPLSPAISAALGGGESTLRARLRHIASLSPPKPRYTVLGEIAQGGMGRVLRVWDELLQRELAMKVVAERPRTGSSSEEIADHERLLDRFLEEARITGMLDHPGIVPVHEIAVDDRANVYFTMPLVRGQTLKRSIELARAEQDGWSRHRVLDVLHTVCRTVAFAHSRGVIHRDLKPDNVMVGEFGEVYVMDWGLALIEGYSGKRTVVGTPAYMAPEQAHCLEEVGPLSDVYSLGAILYELLGGLVPHQTTLTDREPGTTSIEELIEHTPRPLAELGGDAPPELTAICEKAMALAPADRYGSAREMADDLQAWLEGRAVRAYRTDPLTRLRKWRERNLGLSRALEALVLLALLSVTVVLFLEHGKRRTVEAKNVEIEARSYTTNLHAAALQLRALEMNEARRRLLACPEELRGWEWRHLLLCTDAGARVLGGNGSVIRAVAVSDDGRRIATGSEDGIVRVWNPEGEELFVLRGHEEVVRQVLFQPGTSLLASASEDGSVRLWNADTGRAVREVSARGVRAQALAYSRDGALLAVGSADGTTVVRRAADDAQVARFDAPDLPVAELILDPDGAQVDEQPDRHPVCSLAFTPDGAELVVGYFGHVVSWRLFDGREGRRAYVGGGPVVALATAPDGSALFAAVGARAVALQLASFAPLRAFTGHASIVADLALDDSGTRLLTASNDYTVRAWDTRTGTALGVFSGHLEEVNAVAFLPGGEGFVSGSEDETLRLWAWESEAVRRIDAHDGWAMALAFSPDGTRIASTGRDQRLRAWDTVTGEELLTLALPSSSDSVAWLAGDRVVFSGGDGDIRRAVLSSGAPWELCRGASQHPASIAVDPRSGAIVATTHANTVLGWSRESSTPRFELTAPESYATAFQPDGECFAVGGQDGSLVLRNARTGEVVRSLGSADAPVNALAFANRSPRIAVGTGRSVLVRSTETGELVAELSGHDNLLTTVAFSPTDDRIATGSVDKTVRLWNARTGDLLLTLREHLSGVTAVAFSPDGTVLASASKDGTLRLYRTHPTLER